MQQHGLLLRITTCYYSITLHYNKMQFITFVIPYYRTIPVFLNDDSMLAAKYPISERQLIDYRWRVGALH